MTTPNQVRTMSDVYVEAFTNDKIIIEQPDPTVERPVDVAHEQALADARRRIGHLTGSVALGETVEQL